MFQQFIRRPALAIVISLLIVFMGMLAIKSLSLPLTMKVLAILDVGRGRVTGWR